MKIILLVFSMLVVIVWSQPRPMKCGRHPGEICGRNMHNVAINECRRFKHICQMFLVNQQAGGPLPKWTHERLSKCDGIPLGDTAFCRP